MTVEDIICRLEEVNIQLRFKDNDLELEVPNDQPIPDQLIKDLKNRKQDIIDFLRMNNNNGKPSFEMAIPNTNEDGMYPASYGQKRLWILNQFEEEQTAYTVYAFNKIHGELDINAFLSALHLLLDRHEILRTTFVYQDDIVYQKIHDKPINDLGKVFIDKSTDLHAEDFIQSLVKDYSASGFDLEKGPLIRLNLVKLDRETYHFFFSMAHIISDAWSMAILTRDLMEYYQANCQKRKTNLQPLKIQYKNYAFWQKEQLSGENLEKLKKFWLDTFLGELPKLDLRTVFPRPKVKSFRGGTVRFSLSQDLSDRIRRISAENSTPLFTSLLASVFILLNKYTGQDDIIIGTTVAGRDQEELEDQIGFYVNSIPLRAKIDSTFSFQQFLNDTKRNLFQSFANQAFPFDRLVDELQLERDVSRSPLFDVLVELNNAGQTAIQEFRTPDGLQIMRQELDLDSTQYDLSFKFIDSDQIQVNLEYSADLFNRAYAEQLRDRFLGLLDFVTTYPSRSIKDIGIITDSEKVVLQNFEEGPNFLLPELNFIELWEKAVEKYPDHIAIQFNESKLTYRELDDLANKLGNHLLSKFFVKPNEVISILMHRSHWSVIAMLGILKSGAAFLVVHPDLPLERKQYMLANADVDIMLTDSRLMFEAMQYFQGRLFSMDIQMGSLPQIPEKSPFQKVDNQLAYVIYTSGSTGYPKGVKVGNRSLVNYLLWSNSFYFKDKGGYDMGLFTPLSFDLTITSVFTTLLRGDMVQVYEERELVKILEDVIGTANPINAIKLTPSHISILPDLNIQDSNVAVIIVGGEAILKSHLEIISAIMPNARIFNEYGPTEATVGCCIKELELEDSDITIGRPIRNIAIQIVDQEGNLQPIGVPGEIYIQGDCLALGYINQPDLTQQAFITDKITGKRKYKTGDFGFWRHDGELIFIGRKDDQIKLRGYRIELGEITNQLKKNDQIQDAVTVIKNVKENQILTGYVVSKNEIDLNKLKNQLKAFLPDYMIPDQILQIPNIPLTRNGKLDKESLPDPVLGDYKMETYEAPRNELEKSLVEIWVSVLNAEQIGIHDNFFSLGGDSIKAIRTVSQFNKLAKYEIGVKDIFNHQDVASLASYLESNVAQNSTSKENDKWKKVIESMKTELVEHSINRKKLPSDWEDLYPISDIEKGMIFHNFLHAQSGIYHDQFYHQFKDQQFDLNSFIKAFQLLTEKHEILRASYNLVDFDFPIHLVHKYAPEIAEVEYKDIVNLSLIDQKQFITAYMEEDRGQGFDIEKPGLWRVCVFKLGQSEYGILWVFHHAIIDGWSNASLVTELSNVYFTLKTNPSFRPQKIAASYKDYIIDQYRIKNSPKIKDFWVKYLSDYERTDLPFGKLMNREDADDTVRNHSFSISEKLHREISEMAKRNNISVKEFFLAAFTYLIQFTTRSIHDVIIGVVTNGRPEIEGGDQILGCFLNTVPFRAKVPNPLKVQDFLRSIADNLHQQKAFDKLSLMEIVKLLGISNVDQNPLFDIMFNYVDFHIHEELHEHTDGSDTIVGSFENTNTLFDLNVNNTGSISTLSFNFPTNLYSDEEIRRMEYYFRRILHQMVSSDDIQTDQVLGKEELTKVTQTFNETNAPFPHQSTLVDLFKHQVATHPDSVVIEYKEQCITFKELDKRSDELLKILQFNANKRVVKAVGVMMEASIERILAILAIIKGGYAYAPIDPQFPKKRITHILNNANLELVFVDNPESLNGTFGEAVFLSAAKHKASDVKLNPIRFSTEDLVYIIHTSGSTGLPKGVMVPHKGVLNRVDWMWKEMSMNRDDKIIQKTPLIFDVSAWELFLPLCYGSRMVLCEREATLDVELYNSYINRSKITTTHFVPSIMRAFVEAWQLKKPNSLDSLKRVLCSGEAITPELADKYYQLFDMPLFNLYGPTEASVEVSWYPIQKGDNMIPIGVPIANTQLYILDQDRKVVPIGVAGEIYIGGVGLAKGYVNNEALTNEKFVLNPFQNGTKLYRTGDKGRWCEDGNIEFLGRVDHQIKIKGIRVEPGEIEKVMMAYPDVEGVVVSAIENSLVAHFIGKKELDISDILTYLRGHLPSYMIPARLIQLKNFPLTASGKIDRKSLNVEGAGSIAQSKQNILPKNEIEVKLLKIWEQTLGVSNLGVNDNFFELGGDSIKVIQIISRINQAGYRLDMKDIFRYPTIKEVAPKATRLVREIDQSPVVGEIPLSPIQKYFFQSSRKSPHHFNQTILLSSKNRLDSNILEKIFTKVLDHHDMLRAKFSLDKKIPNQILSESKDKLCFIVRDLKEYDNAIPRLEKEAQQFQASLNLENGPLFKVVLFKLPEKDYLLIIVHHLVVDGVSWRIILEDIQQLHQQIMDGVELRLPLKTDSFKVFSENLQTFANSKELLSERIYWARTDQAISESNQFWIPNLKKPNPIIQSKGCEFELSEAETKDIIRVVNAVFGTNVQEVLLTTLGMAVANEFGLPKVPIMLEGHGREQIFPHLNLNRTVGWFTSVFPVLLDFSYNNRPSRQLQEVKETIRKIPNKGIGYGILRFLTAEENLEGYQFKAKPQIIFNYLGQFDEDVNRLSFDIAEASYGSRIDLTEDREYELDFSCLIINNRLKVSLSYGKLQFQEETMQSFMQSYKQELTELILQSKSKHQKETSPSDFSSSELSIDELENIFD